MTNKQCSIQKLVALWGDLLRQKQEKIQDLWKLENQLSTIKIKLKSYGELEKINRMGTDPESFDPMDDLDRSFSYDGSMDL